MLYIIYADIESKREKEAYLAIAQRIPQISGVKGVYLTFGSHDVVVIHEAPDLKTAVQTAVRLRNIPGIIDTETIICMDIEQVFTP